TPSDPVDSLSMGDDHLDTILATKSDEFIKSSIENLVPNLNFLEEIFSNPLFEEEINSMRIHQHHFNAESDLIESLLNRDSSIISSSSKIDSLLDEFAGELTLLKSILPGIDETDCYPENEILLEELPSNYSLSLLINESFHFDIPVFSRPPTKPPDGNTGILNIKMMGDVSDQKLPAKCPMMIHGKNIPTLDVLLFHFYPLDQLKYEGNWVKLSDLKQALRGSVPENLKTLTKGFYPPSLHFLSFSWESCIQILSTNVLSFGTPNKWP
nr:hypothetical protein [Tanacetum cinerariifolium]